MISAIIFDLEGVVADTEPLWGQSVEILLKRRNIPYTPERQSIRHLMMGKTTEESIEILQDEFHFSGDIKEIAEERREIMRGLFKTKTRFIPGFSSFFTNITPSFACAIATSLEPEFITMIDLHLGIKALFNGHIYSIAQVQFKSKPNPDIFLFAAKKLSVSPKNCIVIEDAPNGVTGGKRAGMKVIAITTTTPREKLQNADEIVDGYNQIRL